MTELDANRLIINDVLKLCADISVLYLNKEFSDVTLIVDGENIFAHKVILAARSKFFASLLFGDNSSKTEHALTGVSSDALKKLLKYIYTGIITLESSDLNSDLEMIGLLTEYHLEDLQKPLISKIKNLINTKNVFAILETANLHNLQDLTETCHNFFDTHTEKLRISKGFNSLSQTSMVKLLQRDTFVLPEASIFKIVLDWRKSNTDLDDLVIKCVRLPWMSVVDIVTIVWPSKIIHCDDMLGAIAQIVDVKPKTFKRRAQLEFDINVATSKHGSEVATGTNTTHLLNGNRDLSKYAYHIINDNTGITIKLGNLYSINSIIIKLYDGDLRDYSYYIETSIDQKEWFKILDYSMYPCRSDQTLYFNPVITKYIRIMGTHNTADQGFHIIYFECYHRSDVPKIIQNVIVPTTNVALLSKKAIVVEGTNHNSQFSILDGVLNKSREYMYHRIGAGSIIVQLAQPYAVSSLKIRLWDGDARVYKFYIETSTDKKSWEMAVDRRNQECKSWQHATFSERVTVYIKITGTFNSIDTNFFHCITFECPSPVPKK